MDKVRKVNQTVHRAPPNLNKNSKKSIRPVATNTAIIIAITIPTTIITTKVAAAQKRSINY